MKSSAQTKQEYNVRIKYCISKNENMLHTNCHNQSKQDASIQMRPLLGD